MSSLSEFLTQATAPWWTPVATAGFGVPAGGWVSYKSSRDSDTRRHTQQFEVNRNREDREDAQRFLEDIRRLSINFLEACENIRVQAT